MATITTPTQLATFSQPHASSSKSPHVTLSPVIGDSKSAIAAVRGDGIWTYDLNTLRPTTSFTVPPSTVFSTSPISYWATRTKVVPRVQAAQDIPQVVEVMDVDDDEDLVFEPINEEEEEMKDEEEEDEVVEEKERITLVGVGKEIWLWKGDEGDKEIISIDKPIKSIHHLQSSLYPILVISSNDLYLLDESFKSQKISLPVSSTDLLASKVINSKENSARLIVVDVKGNVSVLQLMTEGTPRVERVSEGKIGDEGKLSFVDISEDGVISALDESNDLYSKELSSLTSPSSPLHLNHPSSHATLLSLPTRGKPLILLPTSHPTPSIILTIPLSSIPTILSSTSISTYTSTGSITHLSIISTKNDIITIGIVLNHSNNDASDSGRSVIYTCELVLPKNGIGMNMLLGTKDKTEIYLSIPAKNENADERVESKLKKDQAEIVGKITNSLKNNDIISAEKAWQNYVSKADQSTFTVTFIKKIINTVFSTALNDEGKLKGAYASQIIKDLIVRGSINDSMWKNSLVGEGLLPCGDWDNILLCLEKLRTIPSITLVKLITSILHPTNNDKTSLSKDIPSLSKLLQLIMISSPSPTFRIDLYQNLSIQDATSILSQFVEWLSEHVKNRSEILKGWDDDVPSSLSSIKSKSNEKIPTLNSIIKYSSILLDSHLNQFLSYEQSYENLENLNELLEPFLNQLNDFKNLRGPIESLLILSKRESRKLNEKNEKNKQKGKQNNKNNNNSKNENNTGNKLPEEKVGKWKIEDLVF